MIELPLLYARTCWYPAIMILRTRYLVANRSRNTLLPTHHPRHNTMVEEIAVVEVAEDTKTI